MNFLNKRIKQLTTDIQRNLSLKKTNRSPHLSTWQKSLKTVKTWKQDVEKMERDRIALKDLARDAIRRDFQKFAEKLDNRELTLESWTDKNNITVTWVGENTEIPKSPFLMDTETESVGRRVAVVGGGSVGRLAAITALQMKNAVKDTPILDEVKRISNEDLEALKGETFYGTSDKTYLEMEAAVKGVLEMDAKPITTSDVTHAADALDYALLQLCDTMSVAPLPVFGWLSERAYEVGVEHYANILHKNEVLTYQDL